MADEKVNTTADTTEPPLAGGEPTPPLAGAGGAGPAGGPVAGDPSSEPVATAQQSHVAGRVGPPTIAQDAAAPWHAPEGVEQIEPGTELPADTVPDGGVVVFAVPDPATFGAGPYGGDTPADEHPATVHQTKPGTDLPGADELPQGTPLPGDKSSSSSTSPTTATTTPSSPGGSSSEPVAAESGPSEPGAATTSGTSSGGDTASASPSGSDSGTSTVHPTGGADTAKRDTPTDSSA
ncbi:MAG TPA: hypothetical protein VIU11_14445 [Nakamurella sp.]